MNAFKERVIITNISRFSICENMDVSVELTGVLRSAIRRMVEGRDVAVAFSGGLDSGIVAAWYFMTKSCNVMVITAGKVKSITERFKNDEGMSVKILGLSVKSRIGYVEMSKLGTVMDQIKKFVVENDKPVIVFDDMEPIIDTNGLNNVMTMLYQILNGAVKKTSSLVVSTGENSLTDKDKELFLHDMERYIA